MSIDKDGELSSDVLDSVAGGGDSQAALPGAKPRVDTKVEVRPDGTTRFTTTAHVGSAPKTIASTDSKKSSG